MKLIRFNPTIKETNKYLSKTVDELLKKHSGVSNEDFERDLVAATGIAWKQVKNYKNHPKPSERLKDNAVVLRFVHDARSKDTSRKVRDYVAACLGVAIIAYAGYWYITKPREIEQFVVHQVPPEAFKTIPTKTRLFLKIPSTGWVLRLGPLKQSDFPIDKFSCFAVQGTNTQNCAFNEPTLQASVILDGTIVRGYSLTAYDADDISNLMGQLEDLLGEQVARFPANDKNIDERNASIGDELIHLLATGPNRHMRPMLSASISLK